MSPALPRPDPAWFVRPDGTDASGGIHGVGHTVRVVTHAHELATALALPAWEREAAVLAALWHDIGRTSDGADYFHGGKSAGKAVGLGLHRGLDARVVEVALHAVTHHASDDGYGEHGARHLPDPEAARRVFRLLKDADALDRVRFGTMNLDVRMLRFDLSRGRLERARALLAAVP